MGPEEKNDFLDYSANQPGIELERIKSTPRTSFTAYRSVLTWTSDRQAHVQT